MRKTADIVVVGAGVIGLCTALQIARRSRAKVVVLDKGRFLGEGSTGASSAVCRTRYTLDEMVRLARDGIRAYRDWEAFVGLPDPLARYHQTGVVWLGDGTTARPEAEAERLKSFGVDAVVLNDTALAELYPAVNPCPRPADVVSGDAHRCSRGGGHLVERGGGYVDPMDAVQDLLRALKALAVEVRFSAEVTGIEQAGGRVTGVTVNAAETIGCGAVINASGPWCPRLLEEAGIANPWPLEATRIQIVHVDRPSSVPGEVPACADLVAGIYFRPQNQGRQILVGSILPEDEREVVDPESFDHGVDDDFARAKIHALQHRLRGLDVIRGVRGYSGLYTMNRRDVHPVLGPTVLAGFHVVNGFSGHGFKLAPAIGSLMARAVTGVALAGDSEVALDFLAFDRQPIELDAKSVLA